MLGRFAEEISLAQIRQAVSAGEAARMHRNEPHPACAVGKDVRQVLLGVYSRADAALDRELSGITVAGILSDVLAEEKASLSF
jgi:DNA-binding IscR family transcriptional regulator